MAITLRSASLEVRVTPERGADIAQIVDRVTDTPLLSVSPTRLARSVSTPADSMAAWIQGYPGGWQLLAPNAGPERTHDGVRQGFHGEASLAIWDVLAQDASSCELETHLLTAPLHLRRVVTLAADTLTVSDTVTNLSPDPVWTRLVQHPAFGAPFLDEDSYLVPGAGTIVTDADAPGSMAGTDVVGPPQEVLPEGPVGGSIRLPGSGSGASLFGALTDFTDAGVLFASPRRGFGIRLRWNRDVLPHAWIWIEANAGAGWPWFRRLYAVAVEPANVLPGDDDAAIGGHRRGGPGTEIPPGESVTMTVTLTREPLHPSTA
ncbi:DUF4432 family protein [Microbacterium sp. P5_E9]